MPKPQSDALKGALAAYAPKLKHLLEVRDMSQPELGRALKRRGETVSQKTINNLVHARHNAQLGNLAAIADHFGVPLWVMLVPNLPVDMIDGEGLKRLNKLIQDYIACSELNREDVERVAGALAKIKS